jgi:hypothetical protein
VIDAEFFNGARDRRRSLPTGIHAVERRGTVRRHQVEGFAETAEKISRVSPVGPMKNDIEPERLPFASPPARIDPLLGEDACVADDDARVQ